MTKMIFVSLPVTCLQASIAFCKTQGFEQNLQFSDAAAACMVWSEAIHARLLTHAKWRTFATIVVGLLACACQPARAQDANPYAEMAPIARYLSDSRTTELELALSAAPAPVSSHAEVLVLEPKGYVTAVPGSNGFVCLVERSWNTYFDDAEFWNPKVRAPNCYNAAAARSVLPAYLKRTAFALEGASRAEIEKRIGDAVASGALTAPEVGSMSYMMSAKSHLSDLAGHSHPHLMFYLPRMEASAWAANLHGAPVTADQGRPEPLTIFYSPTPRWSDGTPVAPVICHASQKTRIHKQWRPPPSIGT